MVDLPKPTSEDARRELEITMLEVELDVFSGMPNPTWVLPTSQEATLHELLSADPNQISPTARADQRLGLGYRGLIVRRIKSDDGPWDRAMSETRVPFSNQFRLGRRAAKKDSAADWLVRTANQVTRLADEVQEVVSRGIVFVPLRRGPRDPTATIDPKRVPQADVDPDVPMTSSRRNMRHGGIVLPTISTRTRTCSTTPKKYGATIAIVSPATISLVCALLCLAGAAGDPPPARGRAAV
jgi:hypothetical protein